VCRARTGRREVAKRCRRENRRQRPSRGVVLQQDASEPYDGAAPPRTNRHLLDIEHAVDGILFEPSSSRVVPGTWSHHMQCSIPGAEQ